MRNKRLEQPGRSVVDGPDGRRGESAYLSLHGEADVEQLQPGATPDPSRREEPVHPRISVAGGRNDMMRGA